jgi:hypothetical protein
MALINFPSDPSVNDEYSFEGRTWIFNGSGWEVKALTAELTVGSSDTEVLFNDDGAIGGDPGLTYNKATATLTVAGGVLTGDVTLDNQSDLRFGEATANGSNYVAFQAPASIAADVTWTLPDADATIAGYALISDGSGTLSWAAAGGGATGGGTDDVFYENSQTVTTNYTITTDKNAMSAGPITIDAGVTVTVPSGSNWVVV